MNIGLPIERVIRAIVFGKTKHLAQGTVLKNDSVALCVIHICHRRHGLHDAPKRLPDVEIGRGSGVAAVPVFFVSCSHTEFLRRSSAVCTAWTGRRAL